MGGLILEPEKRALINSVINQAINARAQGAPTPAPDQSSMMAPQAPMPTQPSLGAAQVAAPATAPKPKSAEDSPEENKLILQMLVKRAGKMLNNMGQ